MTLPKRDNTHCEWLNEHCGYFYTVKNAIHSCTTDFQKLDLVETTDMGKVLILDGITQIAEKNEFQYHEPMVHPAMCTHPRPETVLVIGAGDGAIIREVLKYPSVTSVELAELDAGVIEFSKKHMPSIHDGAFDDPRLSIIITDGRKYVEHNPKKFDVIIMDMTDPFGPSKYLYTQEFFRLVKKSFRNEHGVFCMHTESPVMRPRTFASIQKTLGSVFNTVCPLYVYVQMYSTLWSITVASDASDASAIRSATINSRLKKYGINDLHYYNGAVHKAAQTAFPYITDILSQKSAIITDKHPDVPDEIIHG